MNKYQDALNLLRTWAKKDRDAYSPKHLENINNCANTLQELVDFNKTFMHVLGSIDFKALRNILETKLEHKTFDSFFELEEFIDKNNISAANIINIQFSQNTNIGYYDLHYFK